MTKVFEDLSRGGGATNTLSDGFKIQRLFTVSEIQGNRHDIIPASIFANGIPRVGDPHPSFPLLKCDNVSATPIDADKCDVVASYSTLKIGESSVDEEAEVQITISGSVQGVETNEFFEKGKKQLMRLEYTYPKDKDPEGTDTVKKVVPTAIREQAIIVITLSRLESKHPLNKAIQFVEFTNKKSFLGTGARTWLCTSIDGISNDSGLTYQVTYQFEFKRETWDAVLAFANKENGEIPDDVDKQKKAKRPFALQDTADFSLLKIEQFKGGG